MWKTVLFDLDGTLTDSGEGITKSVQYALKAMGLGEPELSRLECFVGPPLHQQFMDFAHLTSEQADEAVEYYREYYAATGIYENRVYPWIIKLLDMFKKNNITMCVTSSKPTAFCKKVLEYFSMDHYFKYIVGSEMDGQRVLKKEVVEETIQMLGMDKKRDQIVLVGDRREDVVGARECGIACIGVEYGYGSREELEEEHPVYIAETVSDVAECILSQKRTPQKESIPLRIWRVIYPLGIHFLISLIVSSLGAVALTLYETLVKKNTDINIITQNVMNATVLLTGITAAISIPILYMFFRKDKIRRADSGIRKYVWKTEKLRAGTVVATVVFAVAFSYLLNQLIALSNLEQIFPSYSVVESALFDNNNIYMQLICIGVLGPIAEELVMRGLIYRRIRDYINVTWAVILSSVIFGIYHGNMLQFIYATLIGAALALMYERNKNLWIPIIAHMAANIWSVLCSNFAFMGSIESTVIGIVVLMLVEALICAVLGAMLMKPKKVVLVNEENVETIPTNQEEEM
ncbi:MAG: HAD hydrolase-like protein [Lachnospiraceae bacterium]|nr:HAD hydrolase-like protein [Lachnospiraceae bacterium]